MDIVLIASSCFEHTGPLNCHHLARYLSRKRRVLFVESVGLRKPNLTNPHDRRKIVTRLIHKAKQIRTLPRQINENLYVCSPVIIPWHNLPWSPAINKRWLSGQIDHAMRQLDFQNPLLWSMMPYAFSLADRTPFQKIIYQKVDRYEHNPGVDHDQLLALEKQMIAKADVCIGTSLPLVDDLGASNHSVLYWPNVAEVERFAKPQSMPDELKTIKQRGPVIGYVGNIASWKIDLPLLLDFAQNNRDLALVMIGQVGEGDANASTIMTQLSTLENVYSFPPCPHDQLSAYMQHFDVGLIPFVRSELTDASLPLKTFEYLAAGTPVVATEIESLKRLGPITGLHLVDSAKQFTKAIRQILATLPDPKTLQSVARPFSWVNRFKEIEQLISDKK